MPPARRLLSFGWIPALVLALGFAAAFTGARVRQVEWLERQVTPAPAIDGASPTGYAHGLRLLVTPGRNNESYQWIAQTQQMVATGTWRVREVDYDNAPIGRTVYSSSLYRWWLGLLAGIRHLGSGQPIGLDVERAALWADPLLLLLLLAGGTILVARRRGALPAAVFALAAASLYPFGGSFLPGTPDNIGLGLVLAIFSGLALLEGLGAAIPACARRWLIVAGMLGGVGLWLNVGTAVPLLAATMLGASLGERLTRGTAPEVPWRAWSAAGAATSLAGWLVEYAPAHLSLAPARLGENHLFYALAWWGAGELLADRAERRRGAPGQSRGRLALRVVAAAAVLGVPALLLISRTRGFLTPDTFAERLTPLDAVAGPHLFQWLGAETKPLRFLAVLSPLAVLGLGGWLLFRDQATAGTRRALIVVAGPVLVSALLACWQLSWWNQAGATALVLLVAVVGAPPTGKQTRATPARRGALALASILPGFFLLAPPRAPTALDELSDVDRVSLAERDAAHWLTRQHGANRLIALAPPDFTVSLFFHGGARGLGSPYRGNEAGFLAAVRAAGATTTDEAAAIFRQRQVTHILIPPWDNFLDEYARLGGASSENALLPLLHNWLPPRWLRPVAYYLPAVPGIGDAPLVIFATTELQDGATALSRLTEYFVDMGNVRLATLAGRALETDYGTDLGAQVAKARTEIARRDGPAFARSLATLATSLKDGADEALPWDRRVSLTLVLAEGNRATSARAQAQRCLEQMGEPEVRSLSEPVLFRFLTLCKALGLAVDPELRKVAAELLPPRLREQI